MCTHTCTAPRRVRRGGLVASILAVSAVLAGCSAANSPTIDLGHDAAGAPAAESLNELAQARSTDFEGDAAYADANAPGVTGSSTIDRSVITTGTMYMTVEDPIVAADRAAGIVQAAGGRIDARSETAPDEYYAGSASLTLRIPSDSLDAVVDDLRKLGTVDQFSTDSYDVTTEVTDLEAKISTLRASTARIEALLVEAKDISDIIYLENELEYRQARLESLEAQQRGLTDQVSMSTIYLSLTTEPVVIIEEPDDSPENLWEGLVSGWNTLMEFLSGVLIVIGVTLPWIALLAAIVLAVIVPIRARRSRKAPKKPSPSRRDAVSARKPAAKKAAAKK